MKESICNCLTHNQVERVKVLCELLWMPGVSTAGEQRITITIVNSIISYVLIPLLETDALE